MKTSEEILEKISKNVERRKKLEKIRKERRQLNKEIKPQKRRVEIIEYEDGTFSLKGYAYTLPLQKDEVEDAFKAWLNNLLEKGIKLDKKLKGGEEIW